MKLPNEVKAIRARYVATFLVPQGSPGPAFEAIARTWSIRFAEQVAFERRGEGWGTKRADSGRPISKDSIARVFGETLLSWDLLTGTGTGKPKLVEDPGSQDITGQVFVPVAAVNHLGGWTTIPGEPPLPPPPPQVTKIPYNEAHAVAFGLACNAVYLESGAAFDPGMIAVHASRAAWDYYVGGMTWPDSLRKHVNEFRQVYGLPPV